MTTLLELWADSPFGGATWTDVVDVGLLAWLIYRALMLIRGTVAMQSLTGLGLLALIYFVSDFLGLATVHSVLNNLFVYVVLTLIILFQEDIRRALARAGGSVFSSRTVEVDANLLEEIIQAVFELAKRKIGAIVAIERDASLEAYSEGAYPLDARVSKELLQSLFHPSSPVHDGAVILSQGRLSAAGVILPITGSKEISRSYGTRHRAAIGLTEATDALAVVVSEERGTVAIVENGHIMPIADADDLRERLQALLGSVRPETRPANG